MLRTHSISQDLGGGWRLTSVIEPQEGSGIALVVVTKDGKSYTSRFDISRKVLLDDPQTLTAIQLHIIGTVLNQLFRK